MTAELLVKDKEVVVPGQILAKGMGYLPSHGTYRSNDHIIANRLGLLVIEGKVLKSIPLAGRYMPKKNDVIIGKVIDIMLNGWRIEMNCPYTAVLTMKDATFSYISKGSDLSKYFALEDYIVAKIVNVTGQNLVDVSMKGPGLRKLREGRIIKINPYKVPRVIGKKGSMVSMIKNATGCRITVGQNGLVWISGEPDMEIIAVQAMHIVEKESHKAGLTEKIKDYLEKATGKKINVSTKNDIH
jgi:exosome complex component RRP4